MKNKRSILSKLIAAALAVAVVGGTAMSTAVGSVIGTNISVSAAGVDAESVTVGDFSYTIYDDGTAYLSAYNGTKDLSESTLDIPDAFYSDALGGTSKSYIITEIYAPAFSGCEIKQLRLPLRLERISGAFSGALINGFYISDYSSNFYSDDMGLLYTKDKSTLVAYPSALPTDQSTDSQTGELILMSKTTKIGDYAFINCQAEKLVFSDKITSVGNGVFQGSNVTNVTFNGSPDISLNSVSYSGTGIIRMRVNGTFTGATQLSHIEFNGTGGNYATYNDGIYSADYKTLYVCPPGRTTPSAYGLCDGVEKIANYAFLRCYNLAAVDIPASVTSIGSSAFLGETDTIELYVTQDSYAQTYAEDNELTYHVLFAYEENADGTLTITKVDSPYNFIYFPSEINGKQVTVIGNRACYENKIINLANIPDGVTTIGEQAFEYSTLQHLRLPSTLQTIGESAFEGTRLFDVTIPSGTETINKWAFGNCRSLHSVSIPSSVTTIGIGAFYGCTSLSTVYLNEGLESIGKFAFEKTNLLSLKVPSSVTDIGSYAIGYTENDDADDILDTNFKRIVGYAGTAAEEYADANGIPFYQVLQNTSTISAEEVSVGEPITVHLSAIGGEGEHHFFVSYVRYDSEDEDDEIWLNDGSQITDSDIDFTIDEEGIYYVTVLMYDDNYNSMTKEFIVTVKDNALINKTILVKPGEEASLEDLQAGDTITIRGIAAGGTAPYKYAAYYKKTDNTSWKTIRGYSTEPDITFVLPEAGTYDLCSKVMDSTGAVDKRYTTIDVHLPPVKNTTVLTSDTFKAGVPYTFTCTHTGGEAPYYYIVGYYGETSEGDYEKIDDWQTSPKFTFTFPAAGTYLISFGVSCTEDHSDISVNEFIVTVTAADALTNKATLSATSVTLGKSLTIKGAATGGTAPYKYAAYYKKTSDTSWSTIKGYSTTANIDFTPTAAGTYDICSKVMDSKGTVAKVYFTLKVTNQTLTNNSTLSATSIPLGSTVTAKAAATGGTASYQYQVVYKQTTQSTWTVAQAFKTNATVTFKPAKATTYDVCVKVQDSTGTIVKKFFTVKVTQELTNTSTLSATSIKLGSSITAKGAAVGGTAPYQYQVVYKQTTQSTWTTAQAFKTNATVTFKPAKATTYDVCVKVQDSTGTIVKKFFTVKVTQELTNTSTLSATSITLGSSITAKGAAVGGTAPYQYQVVYKQTTQSTWTTAQAFKTNATVTFKPAKATTYDVCVKIQDSTGTIVKKFFTVTVQ